MNILKTMIQRPWTLGSSLVTIVLAIVSALNIENQIYLGYMQLALGSNQILSFLETRTDKTLNRLNTMGLLVGILCLVLGFTIVIGNTAKG